jgi:hypothetical protein
MTPRNPVTVFAVYAALFIAGISYAAAAAEINTPDYAYWDNGNIKEAVRCDARGRVRVRTSFRQDGSLEKREKYDSLGHKTEEANYDGDGKLDENADGWAAMRWYYDRDGKERAQAYYGEDGNLKERKFYSEGGYLVDTQYIGDDDIDPDEETNPDLVGIHTNEYYDSNGRFEGATTAVQ